MEKGPSLSGAVALVFPSTWKETFGLVMIGAMACGCPVIAFRMGSVAEIIEDGVTGFVVDAEEEAIGALQHISGLDRGRIRQRFEERFTSTTMAQKYLHVYEHVVRQVGIIKETRELARSIIVPETDEASVVPGSSATVRELEDIRAALEDTLSQKFDPRPMAARQVSVYL